MLLVYTGRGKGKTCACVGQAMRALGQGMRVTFVQFLKRPDQAGEQRMLSRLLGERFVAAGKGFFRDEAERSQHREAAKAAAEWVLARCCEADMLVLDEAIYALNAGLLLPGEMDALIAACREAGSHLVLSGRDAPDWLVERADLVTEMCEVKHPLHSGVKAMRGIEFQRPEIGKGHLVDVDGKPEKELAGREKEARAVNRRMPRASQQVFWEDGNDQALRQRGTATFGGLAQDA